MTGMLICGDAFGTFLSGTIVPFLAVAAFTTVMLITLSFMAGRALGNAKLTLWAKTELVQLVVSIVSVGILVITVNTFCVIDMSEVAGFFDVNASEGTPFPSINVYNASLAYLNESMLYSHNALTVIRYHLEAYTVMTYFNAFVCDYSVGNVGLGCLFGYSGSQEQPFGGYGAQMATLNAFFASTIIAYFSAMNSLFILLFVYKGFVFLFLPLGVFLRAMPYLRGFGSLLIALAISFLTIFPFMLGVCYLMGGILVDRGNDYVPEDITDNGVDMDDYDEQIFIDSENFAKQLATSMTGVDAVRCTYLASDNAECLAAAIASANLVGGVIPVNSDYFDKDNIPGAVAFAAYAFIAAVFFPTIALLATIASVSYITRLMGEEIDLSRLTQLV